MANHPKMGVFRVTWPIFLNFVAHHIFGAVAYPGFVNGGPRSKIEASSGRAPQARVSRHRGGWGRKSVKVGTSNVVQWLIQRCTSARVIDYCRKECVQGYLEICHRRWNASPLQHKEPQNWPWVNKKPAYALRIFAGNYDKLETVVIAKLLQHQYDGQLHPTLNWHA